MMSIACVVDTRVIPSILPLHDWSQLPLDPGRDCLGRSINPMYLISLQLLELPDDFCKSIVRHMRAHRLLGIRLPPLTRLGSRHPEPDCQRLRPEPRGPAAQS